MSYFEVSIKEVTYNKYGGKAVVAVGIGPKTYPLDGNLPGWKANSFAFHSDDGKVYNQSFFGSEVGVNNPEDIKLIGFGFDGNSLFVSLDGKTPSVIFPIPPSKQIFDMLYPMIGIDDAVVQCNFGSEPFGYLTISPKFSSSYIIHDIKLQTLTHPLQSIKSKHLARCIQPFSKEFNYFEVEVVHICPDGGDVGICVSTKSSPMDFHPHDLLPAEDLLLYGMSNTGRNYRRIVAGTILRCGVDSHRIFFTVNGKQAPNQFTQQIEDLLLGKWFPTIVLVDATVKYKF